MNFVTFIENRYQELTLKNQTSTYSAATDSEIKALHALLTAYRTILKWLLIPKCLVVYLCVLLGFVNEPIPVLVNKAKADKAAEEKAKEEIEKAKLLEEKVPVKLCEKRRILAIEEKT